jgi:hypothetical protein
MTPDGASARLGGKRGVAVALGMASVCVAIMATNGVTGDYVVAALAFLGLAAWQATTLRV